MNSGFFLSFPRMKMLKKANFESPFCNYNSKTLCSYSSIFGTRGSNFGTARILGTQVFR